MNVSTCTNWQLQRSIYFMCKFTWTWIPAPTNSSQRSIYFMCKFTWTWVHASPQLTATAKHLLHVQVHVKDHEREYLPQPTATAKHLLLVQVHTNLSTCPNRQPQRSIYFMCKFTWTWIQAPTDSYSVASTSCATFAWTWIPAPTNSYSVASTSCASSHEREYLPQLTATA